MSKDFDPFEVTNSRVTSTHDHSITIPHFLEFGEQKNIKLFVYKFHNHFDGLIGLDLLENCKIDLKNNVLLTEFANIPLTRYQCRKTNQQEIIPARSSRLVNIPIHYPDGDVLVTEQVMCNCVVHECITSVTDKTGIVELENMTDSDIVISFDQPTQVDVCNIDCTRTEQDPARVKNVLTKLRTDHLNVEEKANLKTLCARYADVFYIEGEALTFTNKIKHSIRTTDELPVYTKSYRYPFIHRQEVRDQITKMLEQGIIRPSDSAWSSPIWVVPKKADASGKQKWRLVVDFRKLNDKTIDDKYPIPNITDVLDKLGRCQYFTTLDLASGFYQVEMNPDDISKTAFNVEHGHFEFLRMAMGLKNSPSTFQRVMDNVLRGLQNEICLVYLDDIIVFSTSLQEHMTNLEKVFNRLRESNFKIQMDKSEFLQLETAYLGHIISREGIKPNPDKIAAIQKYPLPKTNKEIKQFLGLLGYYRKFIPDFARITKPMTKCLKKSKKITLDSEYVDCFEKCKKLLTNDPILQYPDFRKDFVLTTDASNVALGAVLSQGPIGSDKPICYASRTLNDSELNYSTIEKELLAIVWATKYFRLYLYGRKFKILTDHRPLQWAVNMKEPNSKLTRWRLKLSEYDFKIEHKPGKANTNADALSRVEINNEEIESFLSEIDSLVVQQSQSRRSGSSTATAHTSVENPILEIPITDEPLNKFHRQICFTIVGDIKRRTTATKPFDTHTRTLIQVSESSLEQDVVNAIKEYVNPKVKTALKITPTLGMYAILPIIQNQFKSSSMNLVLAKTELEDVKEYLRQQEIIKHYHDGKTNHRGINECYLALSRRYYWPKMKDEITKYINECTVCGQTKYDRNPVRPQFNIVPPATKPFEIVHMDLFTAQSEKYLTFVDSFSKYGQAYHLRDGTAVSILQGLLTYCTHHGLPLTIVTDNGTEFTNQMFAEFTRLHKINHHRTLANSPNDNGIIERFHSTLLEHLRILRLKQKNEPTVNQMPYAILAYNSSVHSFTKCRPHDIVRGHFDPRDPLDIDLTEHLMQQYIVTHREQMKTVYELINQSTTADRTNMMNKINKNREPEVEYEPHQQVFVKNPFAARQKLAPRYTQDTVLADLPIHIYTSKKKGPIAKNRLKRVPKKSKLLQDSTVTDTSPDAGTGDKTRKP